MDNTSLDNIERICAIIVSYNPTNQIKKLYEYVKNQVDYIIIVDNNSNRLSKEIITSLEANSNKVFVITRLENEGIARAMNIGINKAVELGFRWGITFDQDSVPESNMVDIMLKSYRDCNDPKVSIIAPIFIDERFGKISKTNIDDYNYKDVVITSGNLVNFEKIKEIGMYDENLFIDSVDFDICLRNRLKGYKIIQSNNARLIHSLGEEEYIRIGKLNFKINKHSYIRKYYITRNHLYICKKYFTKFPWFCIKKNIFFAQFILKSIFIEGNKTKNIEYIKKGILDYRHKKYGRINIEGE